MSSSLKNVFKLVFSTVASRALGLVRDILMLAYLGLSGLNSAFLFAFALPNLLRRLMGEGALSAALVPVFAKEKENNGLEEAFSFLNKVLTRAGLFLLALVFVSVVICGVFYFCVDEQSRFSIGAVLTILMMPYAFFICLAALLASASNVLESFAIPSFGAIALNVSMILSILIAAYFFEDSVAIVFALCLGVIIGGIIQLALPAWVLRRKGWHFKFDIEPSPELRALLILFLPAFFGASVVQINMLASKSFGFFIEDSALSILYISQRLIELPLGVFIVAIASVYFPKLAAINISGSMQEYAKQYSKAMTATMAISIAAAFGLALFAQDILSMLFEWKNFGTLQLRACVPVLIVGAFSLPFISYSTLALRAFYSKHNTKTPLYVSILVFFANIIFSFALMFEFGVMGLAVASLISSIIQALALQYFFNRQIAKISILNATLLKIVLSALIMCAIGYTIRYYLAMHFDGKVLASIICFLVIALCSLIYFACLYIFKIDELRDFNFKRILKK